MLAAAAGTTVNVTFGLHIEGRDDTEIVHLCLSLLHPCCSTGVLSSRELALRHLLLFLLTSWNQLPFGRTCQL
jgi:hypothetical protein